MSLVGWRKPFYFRILFAAAIAARTPDSPGSPGPSLHRLWGSLRPLVRWRLLGQSGNQPRHQRVEAREQEEARLCLLR